MVEVLSTPESRVGFYHEVFNEPEREQILIEGGQAAKDRRGRDG